MPLPQPIPKLNLERKCRYPSLITAQNILQQVGAHYEGRQSQLDTYFFCASGRLKLRQTDPEKAELIWYDRPNEKGLRASSYHRTRLDNGPSLHATLAAALGLRGFVRKTREVWHWYNVRIHLDEVENLGTFIEFEAMIDDQADEAISLVRLETLGQALGLNPSQDIAGSYSDLLGI